MLSKICDALQTNGVKDHAAKQLERLALSSLGPCGRCKILQSNAEGTGSFTVTTNSSVIFGRSGIALNSAIARVMVDLVASHVRAHGDGGLLAMALCARLVHSSLDLIRDEMPMPIILRAYSLGLKWCTEYLERDDCPCVVEVSWSDMCSLIGLVRSVIGAKSVCRLRPRALQYISTLVLECFIGSLGEDNGGGGGLQPFVRVLPVCGPDHMDSSSLQHAVLLDVPLPPQYKLLTSEELRNVVVVLYDVSLRVPETEIALVAGTGTSGSSSDGKGISNSGKGISNSGSTGHNDSNDHTRYLGGRGRQWSVRQSEIEHLEQLGSMLVQKGVRLLASQKLIHPHLKAFLLRRGVLPLERLSIRHISAVQAVSGARVLSDWSVEALSGNSASATAGGGEEITCLGFLRSMRYSTYAGRKYLCLEGEGESVDSNCQEADKEMHEIADTEIGTGTGTDTDTGTGTDTDTDTDTGTDTDTDTDTDTGTGTGTGAGICRYARDSCNTQRDHRRRRRRHAPDSGVWAEARGAGGTSAARAARTARAAAADSIRRVSRQSRGRCKPVSTLVLCAPDEAGMLELRCAVDAAMRTLSKLLAAHAPEVTAGAGCTEIHLASYLRARAASLVPVDSSSGRAVKHTVPCTQLRSCILNLAAAFEAIAVALQPHSSLHESQEIGANSGSWSAAHQVLGPRQNSNPSSKAFRSRGVDSALASTWRSDDESDDSDGTHGAEAGEPEAGEPEMLADSSCFMGFASGVTCRGCSAQEVLEKLRSSNASTLATTTSASAASAASAYNSSTSTPGGTNSPVVLYGWDPFSSTPRPVLAHQTATKKIMSLQATSKLQKTPLGSDEDQDDEETFLEGTEVLDLLVTKKKSIRSAVEAAVAIIRVKGVIIDTK